MILGSTIKGRGGTEIFCLISCLAKIASILSVIE